MPPSRTEDAPELEPLHLSEQSGVPQHELKQHCPAGHDVPLHGWNDEQNPSRRSMQVQLVGSAALQKQAPLPLHPLQGIRTLQHVLGSQPHEAQQGELTGWHLFSSPEPMVQSHWQPPLRARHLACFAAVLHFFLPHKLLSVPADAADVKTGAKYTAPVVPAARLSKVWRSIRSASVISTYLNSIPGPPLRTEDAPVDEPVHRSEQSGCPQHELKQHCPAGQVLPPAHGWNDEQKPSRRSMHVQVLG
jgi:hypothetical protein